MSPRSIAVVVLLAASACGGGGGGGGGAAKRGAMEIPVDTQPVTAQSVEYTVRGEGTVDVFEQVQVTAKVAGVVDKVRFREGDTIVAGAELATIDADRYDNAEQQAVAAVQLSKVALADAQASLDRRTTLTAGSPGVVSAEEIAGYRTKVDEAKADLASKKLAADRARLDQRDAHVRAPAAGVIQTRDVQTGMYATAGTKLATLVQREPLLVRFDVADADAGQVKVGGKVHFTVDGDDHAWEGTVTLVPEVADPTTRMVRVVAQVTSPDRAQLRAGAFARVQVPIGGNAAAPVIPEISIRPSEKGFLVYTVADGVAHEKVIELGMRTADGLVEVKSGLAVGDVLVVRGAEALHDGSKVKEGGGAPPGGGAASGSGAASGGGSSSSAAPAPAAPTHAGGKP